MRGLGLRHYAAQPELRLPVARRLAFRELGIAIGLSVLDREEWRGAKKDVRAVVDRLTRYVPLQAEIESCWLEPQHRGVDTWHAHENINDVMLATSLEPGDS
jgi:hypothetical protein